MKRRLLAGLLLAGCGSQPATQTSQITPPIEGIVGFGNAGNLPALSGTVQFQRVSAKLKEGKPFLDFGDQIYLPVRHAFTELQDQDGVAVSNTTTDGNGYFAFDVATLPKAYRVRVYSRSAGPVPLVQVQDNTRGDAVYVAQSDLLRDPQFVNIQFASGYDRGGNITVAARPSGAFATYDGILNAALYFQEAGQDPTSVPLCRVNWSIDNDTASGEKSKGHIGTSHFDSSVGGLFILGKAGDDTDEFDWHVLSHEYGHFFQFFAGRGDEAGGAHGQGDIKDAKLSFSEGFGNALGGLVLSDSDYKDISGPTYDSGLAFDLEHNLGADDPNPGWFSEASAGTLIFDLFDPIDPQEPSGLRDNLHLPSSALRQLLLDQRASPALTTLFSFLAPLSTSAQLADLQTLLNFYQKSADFGLNSLDPFAVGETHSGGDARNLPLYRPLADTTVETFGNLDNELGTNRYFILVGDGQARSVTVTTTNTTAKADLSLYTNGKVTASATVVDGSGQLSVPADPGATFVLVLSASSGNVAWTVSVDATP